MKHLLESILSKKSGAYSRIRSVGDNEFVSYGDMNFDEVCEELESRNYYYKMTDEEGSKFISLINGHDYTGAWNYIMKEVRGGDGLWYGNKYTNTVYVLTVSSRSVLVDEILYNPYNSEMTGLLEYTIPMAIKGRQKSWYGKSLPEGKRQIDKLLEK